MSIVLWDKWFASGEDNFNNFNVLSRLGRREKISHIKYIYLHYKTPSPGTRFVSPSHVKSPSIKGLFREWTTSKSSTQPMPREVQC